MEDLIKKYSEKYFTNNPMFTIEGIHAVNHKPHPFLVGPQHIKHASENHGGALNEETLKAVHCAVPGCYIPYEEHTSDTVLFLKLKKMSFLFSLFVLSKMTFIRKFDLSLFMVMLLSSINILVPLQSTLILSPLPFLIETPGDF